MQSTLPPSELFLSTLPAQAGERRRALLVAGGSALVFLVSLPFAQRMIASVGAFIPAYEAALIVCDLTTAVLLFTQYRLARSPSLAVLAGGYVFTALMAGAHLLSFPGAFSATGWLDAGPQTTAWLYTFWHGGFPLFVIAYALLKPRPRTHAARSMRSIVVTLAGVALLATACVLVATLGHAALPELMRNNRYTPAMLLFAPAVWMLGWLALAVLWQRRPHTLLDVWLMAVMCAWSFDMGLSAVFNGGRFDLGFYVGRSFGLLASALVLATLLMDNAKLYAQLIRAHLRERRNTVAAQHLGTQLEAVNTLLTERNLQLEASSRMKSDFLASMSHELRTPLNAIIGFSEMLKDGQAGELPPQQRVFAGHIFDSGQHLLALINDVLDLSRIEAGAAQTMFELLDMGSLLAEAVQPASERAASRQIRLRHEAHGPLGITRGDRRRIQQILDKLLSNAIAFTRAGGEITVRSSLVDRAAAAHSLPGFKRGSRLPLADNGFKDFVQICVSDTGTGLHADDVLKLFAPFPQVGSPLTRQADGPGLGLAMVHGLAQLHGGSVAVTSEPGRGSCFTVWLPWHADAAPPAADRAATRGANAEGPLAMLVEDDDRAATLMRMQLEAEGFRVHHVASAEAALKASEECRPDVIVLDILLPGMDGWDLLALLKDVPPWEHVPVVVVSMAADPQRGFSLGASAVLQKPVSRDALAKSLARLGLIPSGKRDVTVLVVDDDANAVEILANHLHRSGYIVLCAFGGQEGIDMARRYQPDLIALDLEMPEVHGFAVVEALKAAPETARIPVVVITARELSPHDRQQLHGHILQIIDKSEFTQHRFIDEVRRALALPAATASASVAAAPHAVG